MRKAVSLLAAALMLSCTFVSCGSKSSKSDDNTILGKWTVDRGSYVSMGLSPEEISYFNSIGMEFRDDGKYVMSIEYNFTSFIHLDGDKCMIDGQEVEYTYDGKTLSVGKLDFVRTGEPDESSPFGEYNSDYMKNYFGEDTTARIGFPDNGVSYAVEESEIEYTYDPEKKILKQGDDNSESTIELDGDRLTINDSDGSQCVLNRIK